MAIETLVDLFRYELSVLLDADRQSSRILPLLAGAVENEETKRLLEGRETEIIQQIQNLDQCFRLLNEAPTNVVSDMLRGTKRELHAFMEHAPSSSMLTTYVFDAVINGANFKCSCYRRLIEKASLLGYTDCLQLLQQNLAQEATVLGWVSPTAEPVLAR